LAENIKIDSVFSSGAPGRKSPSLCPLKHSQVSGLLTGHTDVVDRAKASGGRVI